MYWFYQELTVSLKTSQLILNWSLNDGFKKLLYRIHKSFSTNIA